MDKEGFRGYEETKENKEQESSALTLFRNVPAWTIRPVGGSFVLALGVIEPVFSGTGGATASGLGCA